MGSVDSFLEDRERELASTDDAEFESRFDRALRGLFKDDVISLKKSGFVGDDMGKLDLMEAILRWRPDYGSAEELALFVLEFGL